MLIELQVTAQAAQLTLNTKRAGLVAEMKSPSQYRAGWLGLSQMRVAGHSQDLMRDTAPTTRRDRARRRSASRSGRVATKVNSSFDGMINPALGMSG